MAEMALVERFIRIGFPYDNALKSVSVLLWIQRAAEIPNLLNTILSAEENVFSTIVKEVEALLGFLSIHASDPTSLRVSHLQTLVSAHNNCSPSITGLLGDRERVRASVDANYKMLSKGKGKMREGPGSKSSSITSNTMEQSGGSQLNPGARSFVPLNAVNRGSEDERCLYLTFSKGHPLTSSEIAMFFREKCNSIGGGSIPNPRAVETVYVHRGEDGTALFGKIVFCNPYLPGFFLGNQKEIKFVVNGKALWCKKFMPRNSRSNS